MRTIELVTSHQNGDVPFARVVQVANATLLSRSNRSREGEQSLPQTNAKDKTMSNEIETRTRNAVAQALRDAADALERISTEPSSWPSLISNTAKATDGEGFGNADVYLAGCSSLSALAERLKLPIFKIGATQQALLVRQEDLRADRYAAAIRQDGEYCSEAGFDDWEMRRLPPVDLSGASITAVPRALRITLNQPFAKFERALRVSLRPRSLDAWARSKAGRSRLIALGINENLIRRFTLYGFGDDVRSSPCSELYVIRPRLDLPYICDVIRKIAA